MSRSLHTISPRITKKLSVTLRSSSSRMGLSGNCSFGSIPSVGSRSTLHCLYLSPMHTEFFTRKHGPISVFVTRGTIGLPSKKLQTEINNRPSVISENLYFIINPLCYLLIIALLVLIHHNGGHLCDHIHYSILDKDLYNEEISHVRFLNQIF